jgi:hypothetical protein
MGQLADQPEVIPAGEGLVDGRVLAGKVRRHRPGGGENAAPWSTDELRRGLLQDTSQRKYRKSP